jgi:hypothetical protein
MGHAESLRMAIPGDNQAWKFYLDDHMNEYQFLFKLLNVCLGWNHEKVF